MAQAQAAGAVWRAQIAEMKLEDKGADTKGDRETTDKQTTSLLPLPQLYIVSPLTRCCQTALHTFADPEEPLPLPHGHEFRPLIKEVDFPAIPSLVPPFPNAPLSCSGRLTSSHPAYP